MNHPYNDVYLAADRRQVLIDESKRYRMCAEANVSRSRPLVRLVCVLAGMMIMAGIYLQEHFQSGVIQERRLSDERTS